MEKNAEIVQRGFQREAAHDWQVAEAKAAAKAKADDGRKKLGFWSSVLFLLSVIRNKPADNLW